MNDFRIINKPKASEFQANEAMYADLIPSDGLLLQHMSLNFTCTESFISSLTDEQLLSKYAEDKWSIKEILMHLIEMERIYNYRMLRFARNDKTPLPGFDDNQYILYSSADHRSCFDLLNELSSVRQSTIKLINGFPDDSLFRFGTVNGYSVTVRALAYHIAGHELHHINVIKERYL